MNDKLTISKQQAELFLLLLQKEYQVIHRKYELLPKEPTGDDLAQESIIRRLPVIATAYQEENCNFFHFFNKKELVGLKALLQENHNLIFDGLQLKRTPLQKANTYFLIESSENSNPYQTMGKFALLGLLQP